MSSKTHVAACGSRAGGAGRHMCTCRDAVQGRGSHTMFSSVACSHDIRAHDAAANDVARVRSAPVSDWCANGKPLSQGGKSVLNSRMKMLAVGLTAAFAMSYSPADAQTISIAVAPSFGKTANDLAGAFSSYYGLNFGVSYNISLQIEDDADIQSDIIAGGTSGPYDLYLASGAVQAASLAINAPSLVSSAFIYAKDVLDLYSPTVDVTGGLPFPLTTKFVMPDPAVDVYGQSAAGVLAFGPWHILPTAIPGGFVSTSPSVGTTYSLVKVGAFPYGFVARSQICRSNSGVKTYTAGSYHHEYGLSNGALPIVLTAATIAKTRTTDQNTVLSNFIAFMTGTADSNGVTTTFGTGIIQGYCFDLP
jgi:molybdate transport system substrate-binding protein